MAVSDMAFGEDYPATFTTQPAPTTRRMELSGIAFGEDQPGLEVSITPQPSHDCGPDN